MKARTGSKMVVICILTLLFTLTRPAHAFVINIDSGARASEPIEIAALLTLITLTPAMLVMLTSFTRIVIVLSLLRQALGLQQTPPNIVLTGLALFLTALVMAPTWQKIKDDALDPYLAGKLEPAAAVEKAQIPLRTFMLRQTRREDVEMVRSLLLRAGVEAAKEPPERMPFYALVISFVSSELTTAFRVGFLIYLPFLVIDLAISAVLMALGMFMLPPGIVSVPLKLLIFVMASGWSTLLGNLVGSFS